TIAAPLLHHCCTIAAPLLHRYRSIAALLPLYCRSIAAPLPLYCRTMHPCLSTHSCMPYFPHICTGPRLTPSLYSKFPIPHRTIAAPCTHVCHFSHTFAPDPANPIIVFQISHTSPHFCRTCTHVCHISHT